MPEPSPLMTAPMVGLAAGALGVAHILAEVIKSLVKSRKNGESSGGWSSILGKLCHTNELIERLIDKQQEVAEWREGDKERHKQHFELTAALARDIDALRRQQGGNQ